MIPRRGRVVKSKKGEAAKFVAGSAIAPKEFDAAGIAEKLHLWWEDGDGQSFIIGQQPIMRPPDVASDALFEERPQIWSRWPEKKIINLLRSKFVRIKPREGELLSEAERVLLHTMEHRRLEQSILSLAGYRSGIYNMGGHRVLVRTSPRLIEPREGAFGTISTFLAGLLGLDGALRLCCWLKIAYEALRDGKRRPGQALFLVGPPDCGKSRIQHNIITLILGGRSPADPKSFFFGRTDFNAEMVAAEHLLIEEIPSSSRHDVRVFFGERIKEIVANDTTRLHKKNRDAVTVSPCWRLSVSCNDNPEKLRCLPPLTEDLAEKLIMLKVAAVPQFWEEFSNAPDPRQAFREAIEAELPAFVHHLVSMEIPERLQGRRYGVASFINDDLRHAMAEDEPHRQLLLLIDKHLFGDGGRERWKGDAEDLKQKLCADDSPVRGSAARLLSGKYASFCGQLLSAIAHELPQRVSSHRSSESRNWIINPPA